MRRVASGSATGETAFKKKSFWRHSVISTNRAGAWCILFAERERGDIGQWWEPAFPLQRATGYRAPNMQRLMAASNEISKCCHDRPRRGMCRDAAHVLAAHLCHQLEDERLHAQL